MTNQGKNTRWKLLTAILLKFKELYLDFDAQKIVESYKNRCSTIGKTVKVLENDGGEYTAKAVDIDSDGHLIVLQESGKTQVLCSGEVKIIF